ncbi:hypothetical protein PRIPAC_90924 [Pristionchus pacificus]|uniref:JmjC domain-containing protein n=1 Tax=Pristionchus pacificus TaxID=54126 RepID=A0A2A6CYF6_PRIPA|nr:hypothetical protein PRIPAC_90924 [Pristionchus pacificus]|eukprot:PDM83061.1 hypothetical protein PRIPAC_37454 [Pristionchus pacificus]
MMPQTASKVLGRKRMPDRPMSRKLDAEERSMICILREKLEDDCITDDERTALAILAAIDKMDDSPCEDPNKGLELRRVKDLPTANEADRSTEEMFDLDRDGNVIARSIGGQSANRESENPRKKTKKLKKPKKDEPQHSFSLLAPPRNRQKTAAELTDTGDALNYDSLFEDRLVPPVPPRHPPLSKQRVGYAPTPVFEITSKEEATSAALQKFAETSPFALFRNLASVMEMDLSVFHLDTFVVDHADHPIEIREQLRLSPDENTDRFGKATWECDSEKSDSTVIKYFTGAFDENFQEAIQRVLGMPTEIEKDDTPSLKKLKTEWKRLSYGDQKAHLKKIKFGTNLDLSNPPHNPKLFKEQHDQLSKLPPFCRIKDDVDLLSLIDHDILGMNTAQCYIKVPANRTPAHIENNAVASVNINIGPGDCEWFGVDYKYYGVVEKMLRKQGIDFLSGSWWPNAEQLLEMGVPVFRFTQREGELVWVGQGCIHWVQALGYCNNVAWNLIPNTHAQLSLAAHQYEINKLKGYQSVVPLHNLFWDIAKKQRVTDEKVQIHSLVKGMLIRSLANVRMIAQWAEKKKGWAITEREREKGEPAYYCVKCQVEIFNIFFCKEEKQTEEGIRLSSMVKEEEVEDNEEEMDEDDGKVYAVYCYDCTRSSGCKKFYAMQEAPLSELEQILDNFKLQIESRDSLSVAPKACNVR